MSVDLLLWILAAICFGIAAAVGERLAFGARLVPLGLLFGALTFIIN